MAPRRGFNRDQFDVIVIGAGLAGLATACSLVENGISSVLVLESEKVPGLHSSGRNAGLIRQAAEDSATTRLCIRGAELIREWSSQSKPIFQQTGSLILADPNQVPEASWDQVEHQCITESEVRRHYPELEEWPGGSARWTPADGVVDVPALIGELIERILHGGGQVSLGTRAGRVRKLESGKFETEIISGSETESPAERTIDSECVVIANGAWARDFSEASGMPVTLSPTNRGCLISECGGFGQQLRPWIWAHVPGWYLRSHGHDLLWSACEEEPSEPGIDSLSQDLEDYWRKKIQPFWGKSISGARLVQRWVGQRTFCPDHRFLLGEDPRCGGWHWAVGLGGHGVTSALAVGEEVASSIQGQGTAPEWAWSQRRFTSETHGIS